jgi:hypothetical protein
MSASTATMAKKKATTLPTTLDDASISDVALEQVLDKVSREPIRVDDKLVMTAKSILGINVDTLKVDQIRKLCSTWNVKKYRSAVRDQLCLIIGQSQQLMGVYAAQDAKLKATKQENQASKFRLLNVVFSDDFFEDFVKMNDKKQKDELDAGKAGNNQRLWSSILDEYNDLENDEVYGVFALVEDEQIGEFAKEFDVTTYIKLGWMKAAAWFKAIVSNYKLALTCFTKSKSSHYQHVMPEELEWEGAIRLPIAPMHPLITP